jgi:hypothetical protein
MGKIFGEVTGKNWRRGPLPDEKGDVFVTNVRRAQATYLDLLLGRAPPSPVASNSSSSSSVGVGPAPILPAAAGGNYRNKSESYKQMLDQGWLSLMIGVRKINGNLLVWPATA